MINLFIGTKYSQIRNCEWMVPKSNNLPVKKQENYYLGGRNCRNSIRIKIIVIKRGETMNRFAKMSDSEIQALIKKVELPTLLVALKGAGLEVGQAFRRNFSDSALEKIKNECVNSMIFSANQDDIAKAQKVILSALK